MRNSLLWNFPGATKVTIGNGLAWQGSVLVPRGEFSSPGNGDINGQVIATSVTSTLTHHRERFAGDTCPEPDDTIALEALCVSEYAQVMTFKFSNTGENARDVTWRDGAQTGQFTVQPGSAEFFDHVTAASA